MYDRTNIILFNSPGSGFMQFIHGMYLLENTVSLIMKDNDWIRRIITRCLTTAPSSGLQWWRTSFCVINSEFFSEQCEIRSVQILLSYFSLSCMVLINILHNIGYCFFKPDIILCRRWVIGMIIYDSFSNYLSSNRKL